MCCGVPRALESIAGMDQESERRALSTAIKATVAAPSDVDAWVLLGRAFAFAGNHDLAAGAYSKALALSPNRTGLAGRLLHERLICCDWREFDQLVMVIERQSADGQAAVDPVCWQTVSTSPRSLRTVVANFEAQRGSIRSIPSVPHRRSADGRIRVGYVAGEFYDHATSVLMAGVWEQHDRACFEIIGFDNGEDAVEREDSVPSSPMRRRVADSFDRLIPIRHLDTQAAATAVRAAGIDILVNLNGYFGAARNDVFRERPAPVQVNYLGFPGTVGDGYLDYMVADRIVVPDDHFSFYSEKVVRLPHSYQANDDRRSITARTGGRKTHGLPTSGFVFACFNSSYKVLPAMLDVWTTILGRVAGSVLWLIEDNPSAARNLRREAAARGLDPSRMVFAPRMPGPDHLARHVHADLFLDSVPYGAHTTASDALWSGLPVLTTLGPTFSSRVAASLLNELGLPELIVSTMPAYIEKAVSLAQDPVGLSELRNRLATNRSTASLFDTVKLTRSLERAYATMQDRAARGLPPEHFDVVA